MSNDPIQMAIDALSSIYEDFDGAELNMSNYRHDDVRALNDCYVGIFQVAEEALTALRQHQQAGGWLPIETLTDAEGDIILLNSARNLVLSMDAKRWRSTIGYPDHLHFHADYWKQINPPTQKKEKDDE